VALVAVKYVGGPCSGKTVKLAPDLVDGGALLCGGAAYSVDFTTSSPVLARYLAKAPAQGGQAAQAIGGYRDLLHATRSSLPSSLASATKITAAAMRRASRRRKVG
jgi:hypothetical protein